MSTTTYTDTLMTSESASQPQLVIWGTNINMHRVKMKFQEFIKCYLVHDEQEQRELLKVGIDITEPYYMQKLDEVQLSSSSSSSYNKASYQSLKRFLGHKPSILSLTII